MCATSRTLAVALAVIVTSTPAAGQPGGADPGPDSDSGADTDTGVPGRLERPRLLVDATPRYPAEAWRQQLEADVVLLLLVDVDGRVAEVEVAAPAGHGFDEEAMVAARKLRFAPARLDGVATPVKIRYTFRFRKPEKDTVTAAPPPGCATDAPPDLRKPAHLTITVYERGKGRALPGVEVYSLDQDRVLLTDDAGKVVIEGPPGGFAVTIRPPGFYPYHRTERLEEGESLEVAYYVRRHRRARYTTIVWGSEGRAEVARTSLADDEIRSVPGTMGDPIRVAMLLPGASTSVSGLGYPIIRGSLPGDSMYEIDGIPVPMLYHLIFGSAVIHPRFVDEITFQPGGYSAEHGRFPGGRIAATTTKVDEPRWVADLSIVETSLLRSQPLDADSDLVAAARYGTLGYIIEGIASNVVFRYWDYQTRLSRRLPNGAKLTLTALGVGDTAGEVDPDTDEESVLRVGFHKLDLRYLQAFGKGWLRGGTQLGYEYFASPEADAGEDQGPDANEYTVRPYLAGGVDLGSGIEVAAGGDFLYQDFGLDFEADQTFPVSPDTGITMGGWLSAEAALGGVVLNPSVRVDHYRYQADAGDARETSFDPRLAIAYTIRPGIEIKGSVGKYSGPSRFSFVEPPIVFGPVPALEGPGLYHGLNHTWQGQLGVETRLPRDLELQVTGFYHQSFAPIDFSLLDEDLLPDPTPCDGDTPSPIPPPRDIEGKSYGAEVLLRRRLGGAFFGWLSYAYSHAERTVPLVGSFPFDFDQRHVLNAVLSWDVGRNWTLGTVFHYNTGRPYTPVTADWCGDYFEERRGAVNSARLPGYWRIDARVQKREVFDTWYFDFYVDFFNAAFQWETIGYEVDNWTGEQEPQTVPLFIPMIGIRGEF